VYRQRPRKNEKKAVRGVKARKRVPIRRPRAKRKKRIERKRVSFGLVR
jgi:hypothetical protein